MIAVTGRCAIVGEKPSIGSDETLHVDVDYTPDEHLLGELPVKLYELAQTWEVELVWIWTQHGVTARFRTKGGARAKFHGRRE